MFCFVFRVGGREHGLPNSCRVAIFVLQRKSEIKFFTASKRKREKIIFYSSTSELWRFKPDGETEVLLFGNVLSIKGVLLFLWIYFHFFLSDFNSVCNQEEPRGIWVRWASMVRTFFFERRKLFLLSAGREMKRWMTSNPRSFDPR